MIPGRNARFMSWVGLSLLMCKTERRREREAGFCSDQQALVQLSPPHGLEITLNLLRTLPTKAPMFVAVSLIRSMLSLTRLVMHLIYRPRR